MQVRELEAEVEGYQSQIGALQVHHISDKPISPSLPAHPSSLPLPHPLP